MSHTAQLQLTLTKIKNWYIKCNTINRQINEIKRQENIQSDEFVRLSKIHIFVMDGNNLTKEEKMKFINGGNGILPELAAEVEAEVEQEEESEEESEDE